MEQAVLEIALCLLDTEEKSGIFFFPGSLFASMPFGMYLFFFFFFTPLYLTSIMRLFSVEVQ